MPRPVPRALDGFAARVPKAELHLHLDGSIRPSTALELARRRGLVTSRTGEAAMRRRLVAPRRCLDQAQLLRAFELPIAVLQDEDALERVARELVVDIASDETRYVEIRWAPALHTAEGLSLDAGIAAVAAGVAAGASATSVAARLVVTAMRSHEPAHNVAVAEAAGRRRDPARDGGVVGFDLAGPEGAFPDASVHRRAFEAARAAGLRITLHAGEWGGSAQVRAALALDPERIAHGAPAVDDPALLAELISRGVTLDLCPTSNVQAGLYPSVAAHPLARLARAGVPVTLSTDDRTVSWLTLVEEYRRALRRSGLSPTELWRIDRRALDVAFADEGTLAPLRSEFDRWAAGEHLLQAAGETAGV